TAYTYTVDAFDGAGNHSAQSASVSVTTLDWVAPTVPGGVAASAPTPTQVNLTWNASTDNVGVTGYTVYRNGSQLATVNGSTLAYTDNSAAAMTTYSYSVDAFDAAGNHSAQSQPLSVTTPAPTDTVPPTVPGGLTAAATSPINVQVSWTASTDDVAVSGYDVYRDGVAVVSVGASTLQYKDTVAAGSTHSYTVDAFDVAGNHSALSSSVAVHVPAQVIFKQATVVTTGTRVTSVTLGLGPVAAGDLIVGWFGQYDSTGQVKVSDSVNGAWTRSAS